MKLFGQKKHLALTGNSQCSILAELDKGKNGTVNFRILASTDSVISEGITLPRLLAAAGNVHGSLSLSLPLALFETVSLVLPAMPDAALKKALPYHLAKAIHRPLSQYIYDWQIVERHRDRISVTVYLLDESLFQDVRTELAKNQIEITHLEADVFSAFAFLEEEKQLREYEAALCVLIWPRSISFAVYEKNILPLVRSVKLSMPAPEASLSENAAVAEEDLYLGDDSEDIPIAPENPEIKQASGEADSIYDETDSVFAEFCILSEKTASQPEGHRIASGNELHEDLVIGAEESVEWKDYFHQINLEIMRTRDYYSSVQKGSAIREIFVGGADEFWDNLVESGHELVGIEMKKLPQPARAGSCPPLLATVAMGAGARR